MSEKGFTLIEITVVLFLIVLMVGISIPKVRDVLSTDRLNKTARQLMGMSRELRSDAAREQVDYELHFDVDRHCLWKYSADMTAEKRDEVKKSAIALPGGVRIRDVQIYGEAKKTNGEAVIRFFKKGYVQPAVVHLAYEDKNMTLVFNPFVSAVKMHNDYVEVWNKEQALGVGR